MQRLIVTLVFLLAAAPAFAQGTAVPGATAAEPVEDSDAPDAVAAKALLTKYLDAVKAKKWADARKLLHPGTLKVIAERKKRLGNEDHPMAPAFHEKKTYWLKAYKVLGGREGPSGTILVETSEDNFQVEEKGVAEGDRACYLLGKQGGAWFVVDKRRGGGTFNKDAVKLGYKGYFDPPPPKAEAAE